MTARGIHWRVRLWSKALPDENGCWIWQASVTQHGYGNFCGVAGIEKHPNSPAHRWAYIARHGAIPEGMQIDHLCNVRACVNPDHLEAVTRAENMRRARERRVALAEGRAA